MKFTIPAFLLASCLSAGAIGLSDYTFKIDDTHSVFRMNGFDIMVGKTDGMLYPEFCRDNSASGPLRQIWWNDEYIFARHAGRKLRNLFPGDTFLEPDDSTNLYYTIHRREQVVAGPFGAQGFTNHLQQLGQQTDIPWERRSVVRTWSYRKYPAQSGVRSHFLMTLMFLPGSLLFGFVGYTLLSLPVFLILVIVKKSCSKAWRLEVWWKRGLKWSMILLVALWGIMTATELFT